MTFAAQTDLFSAHRHNVRVDLAVGAEQIGWCSTDRVVAMPKRRPRIARPALRLGCYWYFLNPAASADASSANQTSAMVAS